MTERWKQVWVTDGGNVKEKELIATLDDGGVRFQGTIPLEGGLSVLDRTTLSPLAEGRVRQLIEESRDGGRTWQVGFDATYVPKASPPPASPQAEQPDRASCSAPEHWQFDFWIGEWDVTTQDGRQAGANRIERILDGCVLQESWTGANGMRGQSFNVYSAADGKWHQTWVDTTGLRLELHGGMQDGRMVLAGDVASRDGGAVLNEISWERLSDGRVRQHWRTSTDDGRSWSNVFVGIYTKRSE